MAAIFSFVFGLARKYRPSLVDGLRVTAWTDPFPALPFVTMASCDAEDLEMLRAGLQRAFSDVETADARAALFLDDCEIADDAAYDIVLEHEQRAAALGYGEVR